MFVLYYGALAAAAVWFEFQTAGDQSLNFSSLLSSGLEFCSADRDDSSSAALALWAPSPTRRGLWSPLYGCA